VVKHGIHGCCEVVSMCCKWLHNRISSDSVLDGRAKWKTIRATRNFIQQPSEVDTPYRNRHSINNEDSAGAQMHHSGEFFRNVEQARLRCYQNVATVH
jgi:hypothetical protein